MPPSSKGIKRSKSGGNPVKLTIDDALARLQYGHFHTRLLLVAGLAVFANSMATMVSLFFPQAVQPGWELSDFQTATITAMLFLGSFVGVFFVNLFGDQMGRRVTFLVSTLTAALFGFLGGLSPNYAVLVCLRFLVGFGLGGTTVPFYSVAEFVPHQYRGQALLKLGIAWSAGSFLVPCLCIPTIGNGNNHWQLLLFLCSIPLVISFVAGLVYLPESPRWLMSKGQNDMALSILREAAIVNQQDPWAICPQSAHLMRGGKTKSKWKAITRLFRKEWRRMIMCLLPTFLVVDFLYFSYVQLIHMAISDTDGDEDEFAFFDIALTSVAEFVGIVVAILCLDRIGRVPTQAVSYLLAAIFIVSVCIGRHFQEGEPEQLAFNYLFYLSFLARLFIFTAINVTWVHTVEILPKKIRSTFHLAAHALSSLGASASAYHMVSPDMTYMIVGIVVGIITLCLSLLTWTFPETKTLSMGNSISRSLSRDGAFSADSGNSEDDEKSAMIDKSQSSSNDAGTVASLGSA